MWLLTCKLSFQLCYSCLCILKLSVGHIQLYYCTLQICVECCSQPSKNVHMAVPEVSHGYHSVFNTTDSAGNKTEGCAMYTITESVADKP
jgi:hypothetical protein